MYRHKKTVKKCIFYLFVKLLIYKTVPEQFSPKQSSFFLHLICAILRLEILSCINWIFLTTLVCKTQVRNRQMIRFKNQVQKSVACKLEMSKIKCRQKRAMLLFIVFVDPVAS